MPIPKRRKHEEESEFISRCMSDLKMREEYDYKQRLAVCIQGSNANDSEYIDVGETSEAAEYQGKNVQLNKPFRTPKGPKKFSVYVKNEKGNVVKVNFGDPDMEIKRDDPERRKSFRSRHKCDKPGPKWKPRYWSCKMWSEKNVQDIL